MALIRKLIKGTLFTKTDGPDREADKETRTVATQPSFTDILFE